MKLKGSILASTLVIFALLSGLVTIALEQYKNDVRIKTRIIKYYENRL
ncbi:MAG: hypothetical protein LBN08_03965 [Lactobacillales bacterium]|jgi:hypothetical protein|nr:hypothetical protein [Lactobacillales bacterium]